jgi:hypothetical protein
LGTLAAAFGQRGVHVNVRVEVVVIRCLPKVRRGQIRRRGVVPAGLFSFIGPRLAVGE